MFSDSSFCYMYLLDIPLLPSELELKMRENVPDDEHPVKNVKDLHIKRSSISP